MKRIMAIMRHWREAKTAFSTLGYLYSGGNDLLNALGGLTDSEMEGLIRWLPTEGVFVEFGTLFGLTAKTIAAARPKLKVIAVDNFSWNPFGLPPRIHEVFTRRILSSEIACGQVEVRCMTSSEFRAVCKAAPSAVFFDALHQYDPVKEEIEWAKDIGVKIITGHDYNNPSPVFGVTRAVDELFPQGVETVGMCWCAK